MKVSAFTLSVLLVACGADTGAQVRASEAATVSQTIDGTEITIAYSRPQARGRSPLFGELVDYGDVWTPGANWATTIEISKSVRINGSELAQGKYSVWMVPNEEAWTVFFDSRDRRFHTQRANPDDAVLSLTVRPDSVPHTEVLSWSFPAYRRDGATLEMRWGTTRIALDIAVEPTGRGRFAGSSEAYVGTYRVSIAMPPGTSGRQPQQLEARVFERDDVLYMHIPPPPGFDVDSLVVLQSRGTNTFRPAYQKNGEMFDVEDQATIVFLVENGKATGFEMRGLQDRVMARGVRQQ